MDQKTNRLYEKRMMSCGMEATITRYENTNKIEVTFSDGTVVDHRSYSDFCKGKIRNPNCKLSRVNEVRTMNNGMQATCIRYGGCNDMDVRFSDGTVVTTTNSRFSRGQVTNPNAAISSGLDKHRTEKIEKDRQERVGQIRYMERSKMNATCIDYINTQKIKVRFADGAVRDTTWWHFDHGVVAHPSQMRTDDPKTRLGRTQEQKNGFTATIIRYDGFYDMDVELDDGTIVYKVDYRAFQEGYIQHPRVKNRHILSLQELAIRYYLKNYGFRKVQKGEWENCGFGQLELDFYNDTVRVAIEYDGEVHRYHENDDANKNLKCQEIGVTLYRLRSPRLGAVDCYDTTNFILDKNKTLSKGLVDCKAELEAILSKHNIPFQSDDINFVRDRDIIMAEYLKVCKDPLREERLGQTIWVASAGQYMTIIEYYSSCDISVRFDDGTAVSHRRYDQFVVGGIKNPNSVIYTSHEKAVQKHTNETKKMKNGQLATIVRYGDYRDIDVRFQDGTVVTNKSYQQFASGGLANPNFPKSERLGTVQRQKCGLEATVIGYENAHNVTLQYTDGVIKRNVHWSDFIAGKAPYYKLHQPKSA